MIKLMIAEDEQLARESIKKLLENYYSEEIEVIAECTDGEAATEKALILKPEIILLDIHMPKKDGLQAAEVIRSYNNDCEIVIITANSEFEYAKRAISLNVNDFLVKPYSIKSFKEAMNKVIEKVKEKKSLAKEKNELEASLENVKTLLEKEFMLDMINGKELSEFDLFTYSKSLSLAGKYFTCSIYKIGDEKQLKQITKELKRQRIAKKSKLLLGYYLNRLVYYVFTDEEKNLDEINKQLSTYLKSQYKLEIFSTSKIFNDLDDLLYSFQITKKDLNSKVIAENSSGYDIPYEMENDLFKLILENDFKKTEEKIDKIIKYIFTKNKDIELAFFEKYVKQLILMIDRIVQQIVSEEKAIININEILPQVDSVNEKDQYRNIIVNYANSCITIIKKYKNNKHVKVIEYAKQYIENNFDKNISLDDVAQHIGLSSNYLSKYFKKVEGINFKDYATNIRIEKAKQLLESSEGNITEIAEKLGYTDASYFSYAFKKKTGVSPKEYYMIKRR